MSLINEYKRTFENFDLCMKCIENIVLIARSQNNFEVTLPIVELLDRLEKQ